MFHADSHIGLQLSGQYNHCEKLIFAATPPYDGTLATYYNLHSSFAHKVPDNMTLEEASLMEPLSVAVYAAVSRGQVRAMQNVLIFGAGPIGLLTAAVCKAYGAKRVVVVDILDDKLAFAKEFAASSIFKPSPPKEGEEKMACSERNANDLVDSLSASDEDNDVKRNGGFDLIMECTGAPPCIQTGLFAAKPRAKFVQVGMGPSDVILPLHRINIREIDMTGVSGPSLFQLNARGANSSSLWPSRSDTALARTRRPSISSLLAKSTLARSSRTATRSRTVSRPSTRPLKARAKTARRS